MKNFILLNITLLIGTCISTAQNCNNWLSTPSTPSYAEIGQINISGNKITVEATINRTTPYSGGSLYAGDVVSKHNTPADVNYLLRPNSAEITTSNGYFQTPGICAIELNKTYHIAMVYDGTTLKFYRNGFLMSQVAASGNLLQNNWKTRIGFYEPQGFNTNFIGYTNEVRIWNIAKTQSELRTYLYSSLPAPATLSGLVAYYTFDNLINKQGNTLYNGVLGGAASINKTNPNCSFFADSCKVTANIGNIINTYSPVLSLAPCSNKITVEDASTFKVGDTVLLIQMKGAIIDSTNAAAFGTILNYKNAGNYEFNYVKSKAGNVIELKNVLTRMYDIPLGKVQLIRVPYYNSVNINSTLSCLPWDGSKGGVLVLNVMDTINMNADIDLSGKGFKGGNGVHGIPPSFYCYENQFYYPLNSVSGAAKGEGIAILSSGKSYGKGKHANGGGGGNSHNSGGGGGSNAASAGFGGYEFEASPCANPAPFDNRGIGGTGLTYNNTINKIFLGGGGGAGHANNPALFYPNGGNGGGICILMADVVKGNNRSVISNGDNALACIGYGATGCHEGMGGGGGAGAILLNVNTFASVAIATVKGGKGADMVQSGNAKVGPGGGGSGGICWIKNLSFPNNLVIDVTPGLNGVCTGYANNTWGTTPGQPGSSLFNLNIPIGTTAFVDTCTVLPVTLRDFSAFVVNNKRIGLLWNTEAEMGIKTYTIQRSEANSSGFISIGAINSTYNRQRNSYMFTDSTAKAGILYYYRLVILENTGQKNYSFTRTAKINININIDNFYITAYPSPTNGIIKLTISNFTGPAFIKVVNNTGQVVIEKMIVGANITSLFIDLNNHPTGNYWINVQTGTDIANKKIVRL